MRKTAFAPSLLLALGLIVILAQAGSAETFGNENVGTGWRGIDDVIRGSWFIAPQNGTVDNLVAYLRDPEGPEEIALAIYKTSDDSLVGYTDNNLFQGQGDGWETMSIIWGGTIESGENYYLVAWTEGSGSALRCEQQYDKGIQDYHAWGSWPNPMSGTVVTDNLFSIYAEYIPSYEWYSVENWINYMETTQWWEVGTWTNYMNAGFFGYWPDEMPEHNQSIHNRITGSWFVAPATTTVTKITGWVAYTNAGLYRFAIYDNTDDSLVGYTEENYQTDPAGGWLALDMISGGNVTEGTVYYLDAFGENMFCLLGYDDMITKGGYDNYTYNGFPDNWTPSPENRIYSIYASYGTYQPTWNEVETWTNYMNATGTAWYSVENWINYMNAQAPPDWNIVNEWNNYMGCSAWLDGWNRRKQQTIAGSTVGVLEDYQLKITIHADNGIDNTTDVFITPAYVQADFSDIRWTRSDGVTLIDHWFENVENDNHAITWVEIPLIPADPASVNVFMYYDNANAPDASSGHNTFPFFDNFNADLSKWDMWDSGATLENGLLNLYPYSFAYVGAWDNFDPNVAVRSRAFFPAGWEIFHNSLLGLTNSDGVPESTPYYMSIMRWQGFYETATLGNYENLHGTGIASSENIRDEWHIIEFSWLENISKMWVDDTLTATQDNDNYIPDIDDPMLNPQIWHEGDNSMYVDWYLVRNYVEPEPTWGAWGAEQEYGWWEVETWTNFIHAFTWYGVENWTNYMTASTWYEVTTWTNYMQASPPEWSSVENWINYMGASPPAWCGVENWVNYMGALPPAWNEVAGWINFINAETVTPTPPEEQPSVWITIIRVLGIIGFFGWAGWKFKNIEDPSSGLEAGVTIIVAILGVVIIWFVADAIGLVLSGLI